MLKQDASVSTSAAEAPKVCALADSTQIAHCLCQNYSQSVHADLVQARVQHITEPGNIENSSAGQFSTHTAGT